MNGKGDNRTLLVMIYCDSDWFLLHFMFYCVFFGGGGDFTF
uniref:Uncharacterized protein n=1 Tax=Anguilla anguilla TaxID=7936 RepID=A0A0E9XFI2_ANGAN